MQVIQIRKPEPPRSHFGETISFFSAAALFVAFYILLAAL